MYSYYERAHYTNCLGNQEEGVGYVRWVQPEYPGIHARGNVRYIETQL